MMVADLGASGGYRNSQWMRMTSVWVAEPPSGSRHRDPGGEFGGKAWNFAYGRSEYAEKSVCLAAWYTYRHCICHYQGRSKKCVCVWYSRVVCIRLKGNHLVCSYARKSYFQRGNNKNRRCTDPGFLFQTDVVMTRRAR